MTTKYSYFFLILLFFVFFSINSFSHNHHKCGLNILLDKDKRERLQRTIFFDSLGNPKVSHRYHISKNNLFKIYYDTTGYNAPPMQDKDKNGVPDYIDSVAYYFEKSYFYQVVELGYLSPIPDNMGRGSDHYDIYIWDLGNSDNPNDDPYDQGGYYGLTSTSDNDIFTYQPFVRAYSYIIIDNDFSPNDSIRTKGGKSSPAYKITGIDALKITAAHEFQHAIQFMYGLSTPSNINIMEMCAVAMEFNLYPEIEDYIQYVSNIFKNLSQYPFGVDNSQTGYGFSIFAKYLKEKFGLGIFKDLWNNVLEGYEVFSALEKAIEKFNTNFKDIWTEFLFWIYHTGNRAIEGKYFPNAKSLPEVKFDKVINYSPPAVNLSKSLRPLEIGFIRFNFEAVEQTFSNDTLDIIYCNTDLNSAKNQYIITNSYFFQVSETIFNNAEYLNKINKYFIDKCDDNIDYFKIELPGKKTNEISYAYPNPFNNLLEDEIIFPAPENAKLYDNAQIIIYNTELIPIFIKNKKIVINGTNRTISINKNELDFANLSSGIYLFAVHTLNDYIYGKFTIISK